MKMLQLEAEDKARSGAPGDGGTVIVGVKLDSQSRELLTWALVKVARPADTVIALHVLANNEIVDRDGKASLLSLVKAFDSVLDVYEGFCNLKQVDLKLKICRGSSIRKIIVREAKCYGATNVIVGAPKNHHSIWSSSTSSLSLPKYCAKKLSKDFCSVLAVNNGKIVFRRDSSPTPTNTTTPKSRGTEDHGRNGLLGAVYKKVSFGKNPKVAAGENDANEVLKNDQNLQVKPRNCSVCGSTTTVGSSWHDSCHQYAVDPCGGDNGGGVDGKSLAIVPVVPPKVEEAPASSVSMLIRQLPESKPGWPLLRRAIKMPSDTCLVRRQISVVQWAMRLPTRQLSSPTLTLDQKHNLDAHSGAIVPVGAQTPASPPSPHRNCKTLPQELEGLHDKFSATCRLFNYQELLSATSNFLPENLIGKGGSSQVYKGCLPDGKELAVKILKPSEDVLKEFVLEIEIITTLSHKNIISLLGFCFEDQNLLLVYDFLSRGSLEENLYGDNKDSLAFGWNERYKVAVGVAEALDYLHCGSAKQVIHRDVKSSNILLSDDFEPQLRYSQLSDFGLAKWGSTTSYMVCTDVAGTFGYLAPEYFMYGKVNNKIDVYAFGVVLLELLSGRKPISNDLPKGQESLVMWAKPILGDGKISKLLDPKLGDNYDRDQMERMVLAATLCVRRSPRARPQMSLVVKLLQGDPEVIEWARLQVKGVEECETLEDEACPLNNLQSHLNLALLDVEDDSRSMSSIEQSVSLEEYLQGRWSRSSSFD
ncbi:hypothetical protein Tsubulata_038188 [Turnera subulata]|uniref:Protein kinase domain-containing protein n=1 Tax=Turnera subulata TaxID=218843 RepID=A0A9Q0FYU1_9ROSI|nr:hypothetical protein Tsubulata_038188 [Turnera subulata]